MASKVCVLLGLFSIWLCVTYSSAQTAATDAPSDVTAGAEDVTGGGTTEAAIEVSTLPPKFSIRLQHVDSSTSSIKFNWTVPKIYEVKYYIVRSNREDSEAITTSADLTETEYTIEDLRRDSIYNVCVTAYNDKEQYHETEQCESFETIALIRDDSLIALFCVIGFLLLCILGGYLCWRYQKNKLEKEAEADEGENAKLNNAHGPPVSIEDRDIPFITPPPDELTPEERKQYEAAASPTRA